jgi:hypothetical protein
MGGEDAIGGAMDMAATGVGLGILTMGAMVPIKMMSNMMNEQTTTKKKKKKGMKMKIPKINI